MLDLSQLKAEIARQNMCGKQASLSRLSLFCAEGEKTFILLELEDDSDK